jgi:M6 family metalloprotease-like protein
VKKLIGVALGLCLSLTLVSVSSVSSAAPQIVGTKCVKAGTFRTTKNVRYQCKKSAQGLRWVTISARSKSTTTTTTTTTTTIQVPTSPSKSLSGADVLLPTDQCKIRHSLSEWDGGLVRTGFPRAPDAALPRQEVVVQVIPVEYPNLRGVKSLSEVLKPIAEGVTDYYLKVSRGRLKFVWRLPEKVLQMPQPIEFYALGPGNNGFSYVQDVLTATDSSIDFSGADFVLVLNPETATRDQIISPTAQQMAKRFKFRTNEGDIFRSTYTSSMTDETGWRVIAHEFAHGLGLPDTYDYSGKTDFMGHFDLMSTADTIELAAWNKWQLGFIDDSQVWCLKTNTNATLWISHVSASTDRPEMILIPASTTTAIVIEARRKERFDLNARVLSEVTDGILVYEINSAFMGGSGPMRAASIHLGGNTGRLARDNEQIQVGKYLISSIERGPWGHAVNIQVVP